MYIHTPQIERSNHLFQVLDLHWRSLDEGNWRICSPFEGWWFFHLLPHRSTHALSDRLAAWILHFGVQCLGV